MRSARDIKSRNKSESNEDSESESEKYQAVQKVITYFPTMNNESTKVEPRSNCIKRCLEIGYYLYYSTVCRLQYISELCPTEDYDLKQTN